MAAMMAQYRARVVVCCLRSSGRRFRLELCYSVRVGLEVTHNSTGESRERYIQRSRVPMLHFQPSLPRLPIPKLSETCSRYLDSVKPVTSSQEVYSRTEAAVNEFLVEGGQGEALDKRLREMDTGNKHTSYVSQRWYNMYLSAREPLVLNHNPFMAWKPDPSITDQALRATNFIRAAVLFRNSLEEGELEPEMFHLNPQKSDNELFRNIVRLVPGSLSWYVAYLWKVFPLDMSQYPRLFCSTRIPRPTIDTLVSHPGHSHVVVMRNGHLYSLPAAQQDGTPVGSDVVYGQLKWILQQPPSPPSHPISFLSASNREWWASVRQEMERESEKNREALTILDSALFVLSLDDSEVTDEVQATHTLLHNHGVNRWFDKSLNLIVTKNGLSAINFEHAWGDGVAVLRFFNELYKYTTSHPCATPTEQGGGSGEGVTKLEFQLNERLKTAIDEARASVHYMCSSLSVCAAQYSRYGSSFIKSCGLRADPLMQLAFQVAYYRVFGELVPSYESCSTAAFRHGRTETIRPATAEALTCAELMSPTHPASVSDMMAAVVTATNKHFELTRNAAMGQGFDRHLFALRTLAEEGEEELPAIFTDQSYRHLCHIILSTSTLSTDSVLIGGFAPVTSDGYGIGYNVDPDSLGCNITTYPARNGKEFMSCLHLTLDHLHSVMRGQNFK